MMPCGCDRLRRRVAPGLPLNPRPSPAPRVPRLLAGPYSEPGRDSRRTDDTRPHSVRRRAPQPLNRRRPSPGSTRPAARERGCGARPTSARRTKSSRSPPECARDPRRAASQRSARDGRPVSAASAERSAADGPRCASVPRGEETRDATPRAAVRQLFDGHHHSVLRHRQRGSSLRSEGVAVAAEKLRHGERRWRQASGLRGRGFGCPIVASRRPIKSVPCPIEDSNRAPPQTRYATGSSGSSLPPAPRRTSAGMLCHRGTDSRVRLSVRLSTGSGDTGVVAFNPITAAVIRQARTHGQPLCSSCCPRPARAR